MGPTAQAVTVYGIPNCDTVKRARAWLTAHGHAVHFHDFKKAGVPADRLDAWIAQLGWERLLNRQGTTWRKLDEAARAAVQDAAAARALMLAQPSVVKRPVVEWREAGSVPEALTVGFDPALWATRRAVPPSPGSRPRS